MANNMRTTLLQAGTAEGLPLTKKAHYIAPDITTVEFAVEIGEVGSITGNENFGGSLAQDWIADPNGTDGTETYVETNRSLF